MWLVLYVSWYLFIYLCFIFFKGGWVVSKLIIGFVLYVDIFGGYKLILSRKII